MENSAIEDTSLPIVAVVDKSMKYSIKVSSATSEEVGKAIGEVPVKGDFLSGVTDMITVGLKAMLGNESVGETEKQDFHVVFANNSLLRIDYMFYKYEFSSKGLINKAQNIFCYYLQVGVLDLEKMDPQILLYELTKAVGESSLPAASRHLKELNAFAKDLYSAINEMGRAAVGEVEGSPSNQPLAIAIANSMFSPKEKEERRKKAIVARYYRHKHTCFFAETEEGGGSPEEYVGSE